MQTFSHNTIATHAKKDAPVKKRKGTQETVIPVEVINLHSFIYFHINAPKTEVLFHIL